MSEERLISSPASARGEVEIIPGVSLVCTVFREASTIEPFLRSLFDMSRHPEELVVLDGGSDDGTVERISSYLDRHPVRTRVAVIVDPTCNLKNHVAPIARGRNIAISQSNGRIIAVTDAGCLIDRDWLCRIAAPFSDERDEIDAVRGSYRIDARTYFETCAALLWNIPGPKDGRTRFIPSSRSFAFKKSAWKLVGGYPERSYTAEDTGFVLLLERAGCKMANALDAVVYWRMRSNLRQFIKLFYLYGRGDGFNSLVPMNVVRNGLKLGMSVGLLAASLLVHPGFLVLLGLHLWFIPFLQRPLEAVRVHNLHKIPLASLLKVIADATYVAGYAAGAFSRLNAQRVS